MTWYASIQTTQRHVLKKGGKIVATFEDADADAADRIARLLNADDDLIAARQRAEEQSASAKGIAVVREHAGGWGVFIDRGGVPNRNPTSHFQGRGAKANAEKTAASYNDS